MANNYYTGQKGERYYEIRKKRRNPKAQVESANVFLPYIRENMVVLDFGCGTGGILSSITCARRLGVEINEPSIAIANENGIEVFRQICDVPDKIADVVMTHHVLEHIEDPLSVLIQLSAKLKDEGVMVVVVPAEEPRRRINREWHENDDKHLYSWNPKTLGNLLQVAGYQIGDSFVMPMGYSRYIEWSRNIPIAFSVLKRIVAKIGSRYSTVCVASKV